ncbi:RES domain-containing protein [Endozoicomonas sp.]|uniref:RES domain-containing protein n=1 Tax=Endozoicomonas sp. TaxID=1892382 RepID=UPI00383B8079
MTAKIKVIEINWLQDFSRSVISEKDPVAIEQKLSWFLGFYDVINYSLAYDRAIWRARICETPHGYSNVKELSHPPKHLTNAGRLNNPSEPIFYASFHNYAALEEVGAKEGDHVHLAGYKICDKRKIRGCIVGEILNIHRSGRASMSEVMENELNKILNKIPHKAGMSYVFMDAFLASILRDKDAPKNNYLHSRILGKLLLESVKGLDAIFYPSVALESAMNIAIKTNVVESALSMTGNSVVRINKKYDYGIYDFSIIRNAKGQFHDGTIVWGE